MSQAAIDVYLIFGFLGSGKTTLLNRLLKEAPKDLKLLVLMNEFGEEGIDGTLIEDPELDMVEISRGSIFCACVKGEFIKALYRIAFVIQPEVLVIEASGVANPTDIGRDLFNPVYKKTFASLKKFCLLDGENFLEQYEIFTAIEKQIEAADNFIVNKMDMCDPEKLRQIKEIVRKHNPDAAFIETAYADVDLTDIFGNREKQRLGDNRSQPSEMKIFDEEELEELAEKILDDDLAQMTPPDRLISITCRWDSGSLDDFRPIADNIPSDVIRAKGFIFEEGRAHLYSHVGRRYEIIPYNGARRVEEGLNKVVFIRSACEEDDIRSIFAKQGIDLLE